MYVLFGLTRISIILEPVQQSKLKNADQKCEDFVVCGNDQPEDLKPLGTLLHSWINWILGMLATIILPLLAKKLGPFAKLKDEVDMVEETVIKVADKIEQAAEKVVEDIAEDLPEGGKFKNALTYVDDVAKEAAKDARDI